MKAKPSEAGAARGLWVLCAVGVVWMFGLNGGNTRSEFAQGFADGYTDSCGDGKAWMGENVWSGFGAGCEGQTPAGGGQGPAEVASS